MSYRTLIVAPTSSLELAPDEVMQVMNVFHGNVLQGPQCDIRALLNILVNPFDIIWFATHGDEKGVYLSDGILSISEITSLVRSAGAGLVVLNTCSSRPIALSIYDELRIPTVATLEKTPDRTAFIFGTLFARKIASGLSFHRAFLESAPGQNRNYIFLPEVEVKTKMPPLIGKLDANLEDVIYLVRRLQIVVSGDSDYNTKGLVPTVNELVAKVDELHEDVDALRTNQTFNRRILVILTIITMLLFITLVVLVFQRSVI